MPRGRTPKDPEQRQRRNKASTAAVLERRPGRTRVPTLTQQILGARVHASTRRWWEQIWKSPMAPRWLESDIEGLYIVAILRNEFFAKPTATVAAEIRQQEARFGLTPIDRRRLDWRIEGPREEPAPPAAAEEAPSAPVEFDPRKVLRAVN